MMRRLLFAATAFLALGGSAVAQFTPEKAADPAPTGSSFGDAVALTIRQHLAVRGLEAQADDTLAGMKLALAGFGYGNSRTNPVRWLDVLVVQGERWGWFPLRILQGFAPPIPEGLCFGGFCNKLDELAQFVKSAPGVLGDANCDTLTVNLHPNGGLLAPTIPLAGSGPIHQDMPTYRLQTAWNPYPFDHASTPGAAVLWGVHHYNLGKPEEMWLGFTRMSTANALPTFAGELPPVRDIATGQWGPSVTRVAGPGGNPSHWSTGNIGKGPGDSKPCPGDGGGSGDYHFYTHWSQNRTETNLNRQNGCTWYAVNYKLSPTGYAYPTHGYVGSAQGVAETILHQPNLALCSVSRWSIQAVADRLFQRAAARSDYTGAPYAPVELSDVRVAGTVPNGSSLSLAPFADFPSAPPPVAPAPPAYPAAPPQYAPLPSSPGGSGDPGGNQGNPNPIDVSHPTVDEPDWQAPEIQMPDWLPSFSQLVVPQSTGECPVFGFSALGEDFAMDTHCTFIEQNRLTIASIMLVVFAFGAYAIVLRA